MELSSPSRPYHAQRNNFLHWFINPPFCERPRQANKTDSTFRVNFHYSLYIIQHTIQSPYTIGCIAAYKRGTWIDGVLRVGNVQMKDGRKDVQPKMRADAFEALLAATYLSRGLDEARRVALSVLGIGKGLA